MRSIVVTALLAGAGAVASATPVSITITNELASGNFAFTPVWFAFHNGGFDSYNGGEPASNFPGLTELAELGQTGPISAAFAASAAAAAGGVDGTLVSSLGAPPFTADESQTFNVNTGDTTINRYFSFASMIVPTNDLFIANGNPFAHEIFDLAGNFTGPVTIQIFGRDVNDNGTELNNAFGEAAFSANGGTRTPENEVIRDFFTLPGDADYLASFIGTGTADGGQITAAFGPDTLIATIRIVPAPAGTGLIALAGLAAARRRR